MSIYMIIQETLGDLINGYKKIMITNDNNRIINNSFANLV